MVKPTSIRLGASLAKLEPQGAAGGLLRVVYWSRGCREQDGASLPTEWVDLAGTWTRIAAVMSRILLGL